MRERVCGKPRGDAHAGARTREAQGGCPCGSAYAVLCGSSFAEFGQCQLFATESYWRLASCRYGAREGCGRLRPRFMGLRLPSMLTKGNDQKGARMWQKYTRLVKL